MFLHRQDTPAQRLLKDLLSDLVARGLNLTISEPGWLSPLYIVLDHSDIEPNWLFNLLCNNGATIRKTEVDSAFLRWCELSILWETNEYDAWWQHQGQEDEIFKKWCEHPYNAWWWQHVIKHISPHTVTLAYGKAFRNSRQLYDILAHLPLAAPMSGLLIELAFKSKQLWSWRQVVLHELEHNFLATWSLEFGENMIHLTVRMYVAESCYSAADAARDILHLRDKGVDMTSRNSYGQTPLEMLLVSGSFRDGLKKLAALLEGKVHKVQELS
ncbi:uncharacterized protein CPUR_03072 [Claviceps purpurea 20.1]|uniref:Ankyrin 3 n=1 Tax=Claviceps purpurea (strain 20.1) TaxID=1111077 RepID=M1WDB4_CLAP2|nr:uncharacterized protein CPUR_03072 [Claviceps purpurea 20.1]